MSDLFREPKGDYGSEAEAAEVPDWFMRYFHAATKSPLFSVSKPFETWMVDKVAMAGSAVPISQILGFSQFTAQVAAQVDTAQTTTSTSYTDLGTVGPTLTGLPDGQYLLIFGCACRNSANAGDNTSFSAFAPQVNADTILDIDQGGHGGTEFSHVSRTVAKTLSNGGNNTVTIKYKVGGGTGTYLNRWLLALRYSNS